MRGRLRSRLRESERELRFVIRLNEYSLKTLSFTSTSSRHNMEGEIHQVVQVNSHTYHTHLGSSQVPLSAGFRDFIFSHFGSLSPISTPIPTTPSTTLPFRLVPDPSSPLTLEFFRPILRRFDPRTKIIKTIRFTLPIRLSWFERELVGLVE